MQIETQNPLYKDSWIPITHFTPKMDKNYAEI